MKKKYSDQKIKKLVNEILKNSFSEKNKYFSPNIGVGIGYDIGLNEFLTLNTFINGFYFQSLKLDGLTQLIDLPSSGNRIATSETTMQQTQTGIILRYHF